MKTVLDQCTPGFIEATLPNGKTVHIRAVWLTDHVAGNLTQHVCLFNHEGFTETQWKNERPIELLEFTHGKEAKNKPVIVPSDLGHPWMVDFDGVTVRFIGNNISIIDTQTHQSTIILGGK